MNEKSNMREESIRILNAPGKNSSISIYKAVIDIRRNNPMPGDLEILLPLIDYHDDMVVAEVLYSLTHVYGSVEDYRDLVFKLSDGDGRDTGEMPIQTEAIECLSLLANNDNNAYNQLLKISESNSTAECPRSRAWKCLARLAGCEWKEDFSAAMIMDPGSDKSNAIRAKVRMALSLNRYPPSLEGRSSKKPGAKKRSGRRQ